jgi:hypothetical protein
VEVQQTTAAELISKSLQIRGSRVKLFAQSTGKFKPGRLASKMREGQHSSRFRVI